MDIYVLNGLSGISGIIDVFESVIWNPQYYGMGSFELTLQATDQTYAMLREDAYLVRGTDVKADGYENVMVVKDRTIRFDAEKGWTMTVSGMGLKSILGKRVVWNQTNLDGTLEAGIRTVVTDAIINPSVADRKISDIVLETAHGYTEEITVQLFGENVATWLQEICTQYGYGWDVAIHNGKYEFRLIKGVDRTFSQSAVPPVVFSQDYDNIAESEYTEQKSDYCNVARIGGEGEGTSKRMTETGSASGLDRSEVYVDGSSVSSNGEIITLATYIKMLQAYGDQFLSGKTMNTTYTGKVIDNGMYVPGVDYDLGDIVQIQDRFANATARITEFIYSEDASGASLLPVFSEFSVS